MNTTHLLNKMQIDSLDDLVLTHILTLARVDDVIELAHTSHRFHVLGVPFLARFARMDAREIVRADSLTLYKARKLNHVEAVCRCKSMACLNFILESEFDANAGLRGACAIGNMKFVNLMVEHGANNWNECEIAARSCDNARIAQFIHEHKDT